MENDSHFYPSTETVIPRHFPKVYERKSGDIIIYLGAISKESREMFIGGCPFWLEGKHSTDEAVNKAIRGFYRLENGVIFQDSFLDNDTLFPFEVIESNEYVDLPVAASSYFGICAFETHKENSIATRQAFGLTYEELDSVLGAYGEFFKLGNCYQRFPRITRATQRDNCCDLSNAWIPRNFPYITFDESDCLFSHVSLGAFYEHLRLLLLHGSRSAVWRAMVRLGAEEELLERIVDMRAPWQPPVRYNEFVEF